MLFEAKIGRERLRCRNLNDYKFKLNRSSLIYFLFIYIFTVFVWDYTFVYQAALVMMFGMTLILYKGRILVKSDYLTLQGLIVLYFTFHTLFGLTSNRSLSYDYLITMFVNLGAIVVILRILNTKHDVELAMKSIVITALFACLYIMIVDRSRLLSGEIGTYVSRPFNIGGGYSHNDIPWLAGLATICLSYFDLIGKKKKLCKILKFFFTIFIVLSGARKSLIFVLFSLILYPYVIMKKGNSGKRALRIIIAAVSLSLIIFVLLNNGFLYSVIGYRFEGLFQGLQTGNYVESSARTRSIMIMTALNAIRQKPLLGNGLNTFRSLSGSFGTWSHINYLELWVSGGIIPVVLFYAYYIKSTVSLWKRRDDALCAAMLSLILFMYVHDMLSVSYISRGAGLALCLIAATMKIYGLNSGSKRATEKIGEYDADA